MLKNVERYHLTAFDHERLGDIAIVRNYLDTALVREEGSLSGPGLVPLP